MHFTTQNKWKKSFENTFEKIVEAYASLPLSLEVMGGFLHKNQSFNMQTRLQIWKGVLKKFETWKILDVDTKDMLWQSLEISYKDLGQLEKDMFLDIA